MPIARPISRQSSTAVLAVCEAAHYCIAVIDFDKDIDQAIEAAAYIQEMFSGKAALVARSASQDHEVLLRAMRAGCNDFIGGKFDEQHSRKR